MIKAILFDFDGTIVDSLKHHLTAWKRSFFETGSDLDDDEVIKRVFYQVNEEKDPKYKVNKLRVSLYEKYLLEAYENLEKHQDIDQVLTQLKQLSISMAIISFSESYIIVEHLKRLNIDKYFDFVLGWSDVEKVKPDPEIAIKAMNRLGVKPDETLLVGDTNWDILTGKNAGTMTGLFIPHTNMSYIDLDVYRKTNPDFEFDDFSTFIDRIKRFL
jgi:HAD superfamily hydrolase (TIGR01509 family)